MFKLLLGVVVSILATNSFAVTVKNCPQRLAVDYTDIVLKTEEAVFKTAEIDGENYAEERAEVLEALGNVRNSQPVERAWDLHSAKNGRCVYKEAATSDGAPEKIEIYSKKGKDILLVQTHLGPRGIILRAYASVLSLNPKKIEVKSNPGVALGIPRSNYSDYTEGGALVFIGHSTDFNVEAVK